MKSHKIPPVVVTLAVSVLAVLGVRTIREAVSPRLTGVTERGWHA